MIDMNGLVRVGKVLKSHGVNGEMAVSVPASLDWTDGLDCLVCMMDGIPVPFFIESLRERSATVILVKFEGYDNVDDIDRFMGVEVFMPARFVAEQDSGEPAWESFIGWKIEDSTAGSIGVIKAVDDSTPNILFLADDGTRERIIPANPAWIREVDRKGRILEYNLPEGLAEL